MALRSLTYLLLIIRPYKDTIVSATTTVLFFTDASCKIPYGTVETDTDAGNGQCGELAVSINSARSSAIDYGCSVTAYTGSDFCSDNATLVPTETCTDMSIGSFSVDCPQINGTNDLGYTTSLASHMSSRTSAPSTISTSTYSVPPSPDSSSQRGSATGIPSPISTRSTTTSSWPLPELTTTLLNDVRSSPSSTFQSLSLPSFSPSSSSSSSSSTSPSPSSSSQGQKGSGNDGGLSGPSTIAIGVVLPGVAVIVAIIFGVLGVKKWKHNRPHLLPNRRWSC